MLKENKGEIQYFRQLDGFRFFSITAVMVAHFISTSFTDRLPFGYGVLFFFVLSSFLITRILLAAKDYNERFSIGNLFSLKQFYARRFLRIFPIYYLLIAVLYTINWYPCRQNILYLLTYTANIRVANGFNIGSFDHLWSLAVEEQFYIFFPFIVFFNNTKNLLKIFVAVTLIGVVGRALLYLHNPTYIPYSNFNTISCLDSLGIGSILAYLSLYKQDVLLRILSKKIYFIGSVLLFLAIMLFSFSRYSGPERANFVSMVFMRLFFNVVSFFLLGYSILLGYKGIFQRILENSIIVFLGRISYGMYLYHLFIPNFVSLVLTRLKIRVAFDSNIMAMIYVPLTIGIASLSWFIIERPINGLKKYFSYRKDLVLTS